MLAPYAVLAVLRNQMATRIRQCVVTCAACLVTMTATQATGGIITINLPHLNQPFTPDTSATFSGDGFVTAFSSGFYNGFSIDNAHSYFQADISGISGQTVTDASLSFFIRGVVDNNVVLTSFASPGTLSHHYLPPNSISTQTVTVNGGGVGGMTNTRNTKLVWSWSGQRG